MSEPIDIREQGDETGAPEDISDLAIAVATIAALEQELKDLKEYAGTRHAAWNREMIADDKADMEAGKEARREKQAARMEANDEERKRTATNVRLRDADLDALQSLLAGAGENAHYVAGPTIDLLRRLGRLEDRIQSENERAAWESAYE